MLYEVFPLKKSETAEGKLGEVEENVHKEPNKKHFTTPNFFLNWLTIEKKFPISGSIYEPKESQHLFPPAIFYFIFD